jgi:hypothetical protein
MSDYYLADLKAEERAQQRQRDKEQTREPKKNAQDMKVTLLGDFLFPSSEAQGCDPYNSTNGKSAREAWRTRRDRR